MPTTMEAFKERKEWTPVPEFGGWDRNNGNNGSPDYSMVFSNARANRKQRKTVLDRSSFTASTDNELILPQGHQPLPSLRPPLPPPPPTKRRQRHFMSYFSCCVMV